jgi:hypothetical protein
MKNLYSCWKMLFFIRKNICLNAFMGLHIEEYNFKLRCWDNNILWLPSSF